MNKMIEEYKKECEVISKNVSVFYQVSMITLMILFALVALILNNIWKILICIPFLVMVCIALFFVCTKIYDRLLKEKAKKISKSNYDIEIKQCEEIIDEYQKRWVANYIRKNKLSKTSKLSIIINELQQEIDKNPTRKYIEILIIPAILSLVIAITNANSVNESAILFFYYIICVVDSICISYFVNNLSQYNIFKKYTGLERLKELLTHAAIKNGR